MISYLGSILYEAHKILLSQSPSLQLDILNARLPHGHCYQKPFFSWFPFLHSSSPSFIYSPLFVLDLFSLVFLYDYSVLVDCKYGPSLYFKEKCRTLWILCAVPLFPSHPSLPFLFCHSLVHAPQVFTHL